MHWVHVRMQQVHVCMRAYNGWYMYVCIQWVHACMRERETGKKTQRVRDTVRDLSSSTMIQWTPCCSWYTFWNTSIMLVQNIVTVWVSIPVLQLYSLCHDERHKMTQMHRIWWRTTTSVEIKWLLLLIQVQQGMHISGQLKKSYSITIKTFFRRVMLIGVLTNSRSTHNKCNIYAVFICLKSPFASSSRLFKLSFV